MNISRDTIILIFAGLLIGIGISMVLIFGLDGDFLDIAKGTNSINAPAVPEVNSPAPDFELESLDGDTVYLSDFQGRPLMINFWATWCGPCRLEMPLFQKYQELYGQELIILAINNGESKEVVLEFVNELDLDLLFLLDKASIMEALYRVRGLPTTFFLDKNGIIKFQHIGTLTESQLRGYLDEIGVIE